MRCSIQFLPAADGARTDHVAVRETDERFDMVVVEASFSGFERSTPQAAARIASHLEPVVASDDAALLAEVRTAASAVGDEAAAWLARVTIEGEAAHVAWIGGFEIQHLRGGNTVSRTRAHVSGVPGRPRWVLRGVGGGYAVEAFDRAGPWTLDPGDRLIVLSHQVAIALEGATVEQRTEELETAVRAVGRGFAVVIDLAVR